MYRSMYKGVHGKEGKIFATMVNPTTVTAAYWNVYTEKWMTTVHEHIAAGSDTEENWLKQGYEASSKLEMLVVTGFTMGDLINAAENHPSTQSGLDSDE